MMDVLVIGSFLVGKMITDCLLFSRGATTKVSGALRGDLAQDWRRTRPND